MRVFIAITAVVLLALFLFGAGIPAIRDLENRLWPTAHAQLAAALWPTTPPTFTPTTTNTPTATPTFTPTNTATATATQTLAPTLTPTLTSTPSLTETPSPSFTPSATTTLTLTSSPTAITAATATPIAIAEAQPAGPEGIIPPEIIAGDDSGSRPPWWLVNGALFALGALLLYASAPRILSALRAYRRDDTLGIAGALAAPLPAGGIVRVNSIARADHTHLVNLGLPPLLVSTLVGEWGEAHSEVERPNPRARRILYTNLWEHVIVATLVQRGMTRKDERPAARVIVSPDRTIFLIDMAQLGGVKIEQWLNLNFTEQLRAATGGCRVVVTGEGGLAVQIGVYPEPAATAAEDQGGAEPEPAPALPAAAPLADARRPRAPYSIGFGIGVDGAMWAPLDALGHIMVSGSTGSGKSYFLRSLAYQLITLPSTQPVRLYLADRAGNVFTPLDAYQVPQLAAPVAKTPDDVIALLEKAVAELRRREALYDAQIQHFPDKLDEYNRIPGVERLPRAVVVLDEVTVLVAETGGQAGAVHAALLALAAQGRKYGFTLVLAGQDFKATTFNTAMTHQLSTRVAFKAGSAHESRVVLGEDGAEALRGAGHGLLRHGGRLVEFQGFFVEKGTLIARCAEIGTMPAVPEPPTLSEWERSLVRYALDELGGAFTRDRLVAAGLGSEYKIRKLIERWKTDGLLVYERRLAGGVEQDVLVVSETLRVLLDE
jgi:hypothetical protein